jgi:arsenite methyltransferase
MSGMGDILSFDVDFNDADTVSAYDELPLWSALFGWMMFKHLPLRRKCVALDVGYGTGFPLLELAQRLGPGGKVYGVDPWDAARQRAMFKAQRCGVDNVEILPGDADALPFPDGMFDLIVSNLGLNNFADPVKALAECGRVSKAGGRLALTTNLQGHMHEFYVVYEATLVEIGRADLVPVLNAHIAGRATVEGVTALFEQAGFRLSAVHQDRAVMRFADGSALLHHYFIKLGFLDGWKAVLPEEIRHSVFMRLEANLNRTAEEQGELALTIPMAYLEGEAVTS